MPDDIKNDDQDQEFDNKAATAAEDENIMAAKMIIR